MTRLARLTSFGLKTVLHNHIESLRTKAKVSFSKEHELTSDESLAKRS